MKAVFALLFLVACASAAQEFLVMCDAGSSGTRCFVYKYDPAKLKESTWSEQPNLGMEALGNRDCRDEFKWMCKDGKEENDIKPGISSFANADRITIKGSAEGPAGEIKDQSLPNYISVLVAGAKGQLPPNTDISNIPIFFYCTAGMRLLDEVTSADVMGEVRKEFKKSGFKFADSQAAVTSGEYEGVVGWIAVSAILQHKIISSNVVAMDMGGASTQLTFPAEDLMANQYPLRWGMAKPKNLYTHSYLHYGQTEAKRQWKAIRYVQVMDDGAFSKSTTPVASSVEKEAQAKSMPRFESTDPCSPRNYAYYWSDGGAKGAKGINVAFKGSSDADKCFEGVKELMRKEDYCSQPPCAVAGEYQPTIPKDRAIYAVSAFAHTATWLGCASEGRYSAGTPIKCLKESARIKCNNADFKGKDREGKDVFGKFDTDNCFNAAYFYNLLTMGYRLPETRLIFFPKFNKLNGMQASWTYGAALLESKILSFTNDLPVASTTAAPTTQSTRRLGPNVATRKAEWEQKQQPTREGAAGDRRQRPAGNNVAQRKAEWEQKAAGGLIAESDAESTATIDSEMD